MTWTPEQLLARAAFIDKQVETWKGNAGYADTLRMEAWALRQAAALSPEDGSVSALRDRADGNADTCIQAFKALRIIQENATDPAIRQVAADTLRMSWLTDETPR
jgi:hypothetical protein